MTYFESWRNSGAEEVAACKLPFAKMPIKLWKLEVVGY
jgi:hypothetical protein